MPTGKAPKHTRKLKQHQDRTNRRRLAKGQKPLPLNKFYGISRKRGRPHRSDHDNKGNQFSNKNTNKESGIEEEKEANIFGFGDEMDPNDPLVAAFSEEMKDGNDDGDNELGDDFASIENTTTTTTTKRVPMDRLEKQQAELSKEILQHQMALNKLKSSDPEFYQHLESIDDDILKFGPLELSGLGETEEDLNDNLAKIERSQMEDIGNEYEVEEPPRKRQRIQTKQTKQKPKQRNDEKVNSFLESDSDDDNDNNNDNDGNDEDLDDMVFGDEIVGDGAYLDGDILHEEIEKSILEISSDELKRLIEKLEEKKSVGALREILRGFCAFVEMCVVGDEEAEEKQSNKKNKGKKKSNIAAKLRMASNPAFEDLIKYCMTRLAPYIPKILDIDNKQQNNISFLEKNGKVQKHFALLRRYFKSIYIFLASVSDEVMQRLILMHLKELHYIILILNEKNKRLFIKHVCHLWSCSGAAVRIESFLFLYEMGKKMKSKELHKLYKFMYQSFVIICKRVSLKTMSGINFMINCMVQMYDINPIVAYQEAFHRLRSIAFHVKQGKETMAKHEMKGDNNKERMKRHSMKLKQSKEDTINSIYNWRFVNLIRLWGKVIGSQSKIRNSDLHLLVYPFAQIVTTVLTLSRSHELNPGRLKLITCLIELIEKCQKCGINDRRVYVPLVPYLITMMNNPAFSKTQKKVNKSQQKNKKNNKNRNKNKNKWQQEEKEEEEKKKVDLRFKLKTASNDFGTIEYQSALMDSITGLMIRYFASYSCELSFPELSFPVLMFLSDFLENGNIASELKVRARTLSRKLRENSDWIDNKRKNVTFSPKDFQRVYAFLHHERNSDLSPLGKFMNSKQYKDMFHLPDHPKLKRQAAKRSNIRNSNSNSNSN